MQFYTRLTLLGVTLLCPFVLASQELDPRDYDYPLRDVAGYFSANFGEMRSNHFHSGVDFKTNGVEGKPVVAVADGYVSRILNSPSGYGRALYITHPNGTTSVYGHLQRFAPEIERYVEQQRYRRKQNRVDLYCDSTQFRVVRGEEIGKSGNSGTSFGPHLHFEIRETASQRTLNLFAQGLYRPKDAIPPYIFRLHYIEVDTMRGVPMHAPRRSFEVEKVDKHTYRLKQQEPLQVGRNGYFVVEVSDRKDEVSNRYGVYSIRASRDGIPFVEYRLDGFTFDRTRYCNAVSDYSLQRTSRNEVIRLAKLTGCPREFYPTLENRGMLAVAPSERAQIEILVTDDCANHSSLKFWVEGMAAEAHFVAPADSTSRIIDRRYNFRHEQEGLSVLIPRYALYESMLYHQKQSHRSLPHDPTVVLLSPHYTLLDASVPLHKPILVAIECFVPTELQSKVMLGMRNRKGHLTCQGGAYERGRVEASVGALGEYCVVADTLAPTIRPTFERGADLRKRNAVNIHLKDNFSGVRMWSAYLDGEWVAWDYHPVRGYATLDLSRLRRQEGFVSGSHSLKFVVTDPCGNLALWEGEVLL